MREERFTVHLLEENQTLAAEVFAGRIGDGRPRTEQVEWHERAGGRLAGALSYVECRLARVVPVFSHVLLIGVVEVVESGAGTHPLVHFDGSYRRLARDEAD
jgi:flavin reductase (DIM6/NTAB) family NADH-FMN oxidoreductase RutF